MNAMAKVTGGDSNVRTSPRKNMALVFPAVAAFLMLRRCSSWALEVRRRRPR